MDLHGDPESRGRGFGELAMRLLLEYGFRTLRPRSLYVMAYNGARFSCIRSLVLGMR